MSTPSRNFPQEAIKLLQLVNPCSEELIMQFRRICKDFTYFETYLDYFRDPYYTVVVVKIEEKIRGFLVFSRHSFTIYGDFLWVEEDYRNRKIGTRLIEYLSNYTETKGYRALQGDTLFSDLGAQRLYERIGAKKIGEYDNLFGNGMETMYIYRKKYLNNF